MTRERPKQHNPAADPERENGQGKHEGVPHDPKEFDTLNPAKQKDIRQDADNPVEPDGRKPDTAMCENRDRPGMVDKSEDC